MENNLKTATVYLVSTCDMCDKERRTCYGVVDMNHLEVLAVCEECYRKYVNNATK